MYTGFMTTQAAEYNSYENLLSGVSTEAGVSQSTEEAGLSGSFMLLTPYCLLLTMATCGAHTVYPSPKVIRIKKKRRRRRISHSSVKETRCYCTLL